MLILCMILGILLIVISGTLLLVNIRNFREEINLIALIDHGDDEARKKCVELYLSNYRRFCEKYQTKLEG